MLNLNKTFLCVLSVASAFSVQAAGWQTLYNPDGTIYSSEQYSEILSQEITAEYKDGSTENVSALLNNSGDKIWFNVPATLPKLGLEVAIKWTGGEATSYAGEMPTSDTNAKIFNTLTSTMLTPTPGDTPKLEELMAQTLHEENNNIAISPWWVAGQHTSNYYVNPVNVHLESSIHSSSYVTVQGMHSEAGSIFQSGVREKNGRFSGRLLACDGLTASPMIAEEQGGYPSLQVVTTVNYQDLDTTKAETIKNVYLEHECVYAVPTT